MTICTNLKTGEHTIIEPMSEADSKMAVKVLISLYELNSRRERAKQLKGE